MVLGANAGLEGLWFSYLLQGLGFRVQGKGVSGFVTSGLGVSEAFKVQGVGFRF